MRWLKQKIARLWWRTSPLTGFWEPRRHWLVMAGVLFGTATLLGCSATVQRGGLNWPSERFSLQVQRVLPAIVEVVSLYEYDVHEYLYARDAAGNFIPDTGSGFGFRMRSDASRRSIVERLERHMAYGSGVLIGRSPDAFLVLTNRHIVVKKDSLVEYLRVGDQLTRAPIFKAYLRKHDLTIRGKNNTLVKCELIVQDNRYDLALLSVAAADVAGEVLPVAPASEPLPGPGKLAIITGYPDEIRQAAIGLTGEAPYPGNFSISAYGDFGYSGGGVFTEGEGGEFELIGIGRSIPAKTVSYIGPDDALSRRNGLFPEDLPHLRVDRMNLVNPSRMFAIAMRQIRAFIKKNYNTIDLRQFELDNKFLE